MIRKTTIDQVGSDLDLTEADYRLEALKFTATLLPEQAGLKPEEIIHLADQFADYIINGITTKEESTK